MNVLRTAFLIASCACAMQAQVNFTYRTSANPAPVSLPNNGSVVFAPASVGNSSTVTVIATNTANETLRLTSAGVTGDTQFRLTYTGGDLAPGASLNLTLSFTPDTRQAASGSLNVQFARANGTGLSYNFFLTGTGQAADMVASYVIAPDGNQIPVNDGGVVTFPQTAVKATSTATFIIVNRGNGAGTVNSVSLTGDEFKLAGLPLLPATVQPNSDLRFNVLYQPVTGANAAGSVRVDVGGRVVTIALMGQGASAALTYEFAMADGVTPISAGSTIRLPDTPVGSTSSGVVRVRNTGNLETRLGAIAVVGSAFKLSDVPPLPASVPAGGALAFTLTFTPATPADATATLLIDNFTVSVSGTGTGPQLVYSSRTGSASSPIPEGGGIIFPNTAVGGTTTVFVNIANQGNAPGTVNGISSSSAAFSLGGLPPLPAVIAPGQSLEFPVAFSPASTGAVTATLQIDNRAIPLRGIGDNPPPLPQVQFTNLGDTASALDQPSVGLTLAQPYSIDLTGKLTLSFTPDSFSDDPNIQFASGGRSVDFRIPANTTEAIFGESARSVQFQAGTVAGVIAATASFNAGAAVLTPNPAPSKTVMVAAAPPQIRNVQVGARTGTSFELLVTGISVTRSVTQINLAFTASPGASLQTPNLTINAEAPFAAWYQSPASRAFGSQFTVSLVVNVAGDPAAVQSVAVTAQNARGSSTPVSVNLR